MANTAKFNTIMPESDDRVLCVKIDKPISIEGYEHNFLPRLHKMIDTYGDVRMLVYYETYKGWEEQAAMLDMSYTLIYGPRLAKMALVNAPQKEIFQRQFKQPLLAGETRFFDKEDLDQALAWVRS